MTHSSRAIVAAASLVIALGLSGCGADEVQLNGKIFDALGVSGNGNTRSAEPKMVARAPLVVPPTLERLPEPGKPAEAASQTATLAALADPDKKVVLNQAELERQQADYCKVHYEYAKHHGDPDADEATGPLGPCRTTAISIFKKFQAGSSDSDGQEGQVEKN